MWRGRPRCLDKSQVMDAGIIFGAVAFFVVLLAIWLA